jgi:hypothetical protein
MLRFSNLTLIALVNTPSTNCNHCQHPIPSTPLITSPSPLHPSSSINSLPSILPYLSTSNSASYSDETSYWGDSIHCSPGDLHRVYFQNLDGLRNDNEEIDLYVESMLQYQVGTFCWTDPSLDFTQPAAKSKIQSHTLAHFKTARTAFSSSIIHNEGNSLYKPGGTLTTTTGKWTTRSIGQPITDDSGMGRWSGLSFLGKNGRQLSILTAYRSPRQ